MKQGSSIPLIIWFADVVSKVCFSVVTELKFPKAQNPFWSSSCPWLKMQWSSLAWKCWLRPCWGKGSCCWIFCIPCAILDLSSYLFLVHFNSAEGRGSCNMGIFTSCCQFLAAPLPAREQNWSIKDVSATYAHEWWNIVSRVGRPPQASRFVCFSKVEYGEFFFHVRGTGMGLSTSHFFLLLLYSGKREAKSLRELSMCWFFPSCHAGVLCPFIKIKIYK